MVNLTENLDRTYWENLVEPYEQKSGVNVEIVGPDDGNVAATYQKQLAAGTPPDVVQSIFPDENSAKHLVDFSDEKWAQDTPMFDTYAMHGKHYTVGVGEQIQSLIFYNKTAFKEAGLTKPPTTWDEFGEDLGKLNDAGYTPLQTAGDFQTGLQLQQMYHPDLNELHPNWQTLVSDSQDGAGELYKPMFQHYADWLDSKYISKDDVDVTPADADQDFIDGKAGFYCNGSWYAATIESAGRMPFEVGVFSPPVSKGNYPGPQGATMANSYMVHKESRNVEAAKGLVQFLTTDKTVIIVQLKADGSFRQDAIMGQSDIGTQVQNVLDDAPKLVAVGEGFGDTKLPVTGFNPKFTEIAQSLYKGTSPSEAATNLDRWVDQNR
ncbi:ABC transporter substrate-binding protein [Streptomyces sp. NPDC050560]|uniref:ABC transporter substrate-binding protein n=1 Tax=Streptomyces sp. NPDC050560 TaxID=3365630 RepID=UPI00379264CE